MSSRSERLLFLYFVIGVVIYYAGRGGDSKAHAAPARRRSARHLSVAQHLVTGLTQ